MPIHDWTRVSAGTFHDFHNSWITHIKEALNAGLLPEEYYALGEQQAEDIGPDILTLRNAGDDGAAEESINFMDLDPEGAVAIAAAPPQVKLTLEADDEMSFYLNRQRTIVIRHQSNDQMVAIVEIISPSNRHSSRSLDVLVNKIVASLRDGIHVVIIDCFPIGKNDPDGIHGLVWQQLMAGDYSQPKDCPLTLVSYKAGHPLTAYLEPSAVGDSLTPLPLFLTDQHYIPLPLNETYDQSWAGVPRRWKKVIE